MNVYSAVCHKWTGNTLLTLSRLQSNTVNKTNLMTIQQTHKDTKQHAMNDTWLASNGYSSGNSSPSSSTWTRFNLLAADVTCSSCFIAIFTTSSFCSYNKLIHYRQAVLHTVIIILSTVSINQCPITIITLLTVQQHQSMSITGIGKLFYTYWLLYYQQFNNVNHWHCCLFPRLQMFWFS